MNGPREREKGEERTNFACEKESDSIFTSNLWAGSIDLFVFGPLSFLTLVYSTSWTRWRRSNFDFRNFFSLCIYIYMSDPY